MQLFSELAVLEHPQSYVLPLTSDIALFHFIRQATGLNRGYRSYRGVSVENMDPTRVPMSRVAGVCYHVTRGHGLIVWGTVKH
jgi:hypothetical protein